MNLHHLRYFLELAEIKNYRQTADKLFISQPALSKAIRGLEEELNVQLFERVGNENVLTTYGRLFLSHVTKSLQILDEGIVQVTSLSEERQNVIRIGTIDTTATQFIPVSIRDFSTQFPYASFQCDQALSSQIVDNVEKGKIDIGIISDYPIPDHYRYIEKVEILSYNGIVVVPSDHRFANRDSIKIKEILDEPFIGYTSECGNLKSLNSIFTKNNIQMPRYIKIRYDFESAILSAVKNGLGVAIVSDTKFNRQSDVSYLTIEDLDIQFPAFMVWKSKNISSSVVSAYRNFILRKHQMEGFSKLNE